MAPKARKEFHAMPGTRLITRKRTIVAFVGGAAAIVLLMSACGGSPSAMSMPAGSGSSDAMSMPSGGGSGPASGAAVHTDTVAITNLAFSPSAITVAAGATVTWTNEDGIQHDVYAPSLGLKSAVLNQNESYTHTFSKPGTYSYICSIHPFMHGTVVVTAK
jgi:plastocyanin